MLGGFSQLRRTPRPGTMSALCGPSCFVAFPSRGKNPRRKCRRGAADCILVQGLTRAGDPIALLEERKSLGSNCQPQYQLGQWPALLQLTRRGLFSRVLTGLFTNPATFCVLEHCMKPGPYSRPRNGGSTPPGTAMLATSGRRAASEYRGPWCWLYSRWALHPNRPGRPG